VPRLPCSGDRAAVIGGRTASLHFVPALPGMMSIEGAVVMIDAIGCQRDDAGRLCSIARSSNFAIEIA
jgi:hypothetical protein